ncbi:hypothetical protein G8770_10825 [Aestuariicella hydrocarbonica]|uniref:Uncharacterized protein n=1 Tax=Pseudomaricurvus hydrocarbonicus TaxID=1470433 RepID=A0A9E5MKY5_9GAMM|nr:hypothetical protein [Aestuariicella hydrocarbonica]NHO66037.1 hypothetical protein [Aestuariicella hydrocarbonica]
MTEENAFYAFTTLVLTLLTFLFRKNWSRHIVLILFLCLIIELAFFRPGVVYRQVMLSQEIVDKSESIKVDDAVRNYLHLTERNNLSIIILVLGLAVLSIHNNGKK